MVVIYLIKVNNQRYIGRTSNFIRRSKRHLSRLKAGTHPNIILQRSYNKNKDYSICKVVECPDSQQEFWEQLFIDNTQNCNLSSSSGFSKGYKFSEERNKKVSESLKGRKLSKSHRANISLAFRGEKHPQYCKDLIKFEHPEHGIVECTSYELRLKYNLQAGNLSQLINGKRNTHKGWRIYNAIP